LKHLDVSGNQLTELPAELGMCMFLKDLLLFDNHIRSLPYELGSLYELEMLGIEGNPLDPYLKEEIIERGTKALISRLREEAPSMSFPRNRAFLILMILSTCSPTCSPHARTSR
jgi:CCR4-NOT transcription complex subunit 6